MTKSNNKINQKNRQMTENQHITKKLTIVEELEYQVKIAKAIEIIEKEAINPICLYTDLTGEKITLGGNRNRFTIDNLKHFKELYTIVYDKKINNKEWLKVFKAVKIYNNIDSDKYWDLKRTIELEVKNNNQ